MSYKKKKKVEIYRDIVTLQWIAEDTLPGYNAER